MMNEEHRMKNEVEIDHGRDSVALRPRFFFFSSIFTENSQYWMLNPFFNLPYIYL